MCQQKRLTEGRPRLSTFCCQTLALLSVRASATAEAQSTIGPAILLCEMASTRRYPCEVVPSTTMSPDCGVAIVDSDRYDTAGERCKSDVVLTAPFAPAGGRGRSEAHFARGLRWARFAPWSDATNGPPQGPPEA